jgi:CheY-like chemotaxis protein
MEHKIFSLLSAEDLSKAEAIRRHATTLLDNSHRYEFFTLHGSQHIENILCIVDILIDGGLTLTNKQAFYLICAIYTHDIGMVVPLNELDKTKLFCGIPQPPEPSEIEVFIRSLHHELIDKYVDNNFEFLSSLGMSVFECNLMKSIAKCHRRRDLNKESGFIASLGALLRVVDELDLYPSRAPIAFLTRNYHDMDSTSCWHWFKHNICEDWLVEHNVTFEKGKVNIINFHVGVHPSRADSIRYWQKRIVKPIHKELIDEGAGKIITEAFGIKINVDYSDDLSQAVLLNEEWNGIEDKALSDGLKVILVVDDEAKKLEDLFFPLMGEYHIVFSKNAKDALERLSAIKVDLAVVDLQIGSGFMWDEEETQNYKMTGLKLCKEILKSHKDTKVGILTGSKYDLDEVKSIRELSFLLKKPIDPDKFEVEVKNVLK